MSSVCINIANLGEKPFSCSFSLGVDFLQRYSGGLAPEGQFLAEVVLTKTDTFIEANFYIRGVFQLTCDRSLRAFSYPVEMEKKMIFKYGDENRELSEDIMLISRRTTDLEMGQLMYDWIGLAVPVKKLHPDCRDKCDDDIVGEVVYSTGSSVLGNAGGAGHVYKK